MMDEKHTKRYQAREMQANTILRDYFHRLTNICYFHRLTNIKTVLSTDSVDKNVRQQEPICISDGVTD